VGLGRPAGYGTEPSGLNATGPWAESPGPVTRLSRTVSCTEPRPCRRSARTTEQTPRTLIIGPTPTRRKAGTRPPWRCRLTSVLPGRNYVENYVTSRRHPASPIRPAPVRTHPGGSGTVTATTRRPDRSASVAARFAVVETAESVSVNTPAWAGTGSEKASAPPGPTTPRERPRRRTSARPRSSGARRTCSPPRSRPAGPARRTGPGWR
jgi:hypothetical protein